MPQRRPALRLVSIGSERSFGLVFAGVFLIVALFPLTGDGSVRIWALVVAGAFAVAAFSAPYLLRPLNRLWFRLGLLLNKIVGAEPRNLTSFDRDPAPAFSAGERG